MRDDLPRVLDGHNDVLTRLHEAGGVAAAERFVEGSTNHVDLPKARAGGLAGGFFALWVASPSDGSTSYQEAMRRPSYDLPLPAPIERAEARRVVDVQLAILGRLEALGAVRVCTTVSALRDRLADESGPLAAIAHLEGAEAIDPELGALETLHARGLRSLGPVWSRPTIWGEGVPFRFPGSPDTGPGLTDLGVALVRRCGELGILVDCSHLNQAGFLDVAHHGGGPVVATHSNAHALCPQTRNLTDAQLEIVRDTDGLVGLNFACAFLREDGQMSAATPLETMLAHLDHLIERVGEDGVALGSDFDGAVVPESIGDASGLAALRRALRAHGYDEPLLAKLCHGNWLRVLERVWRTADEASGADVPRGREASASRRATDGSVREDSRARAAKA